MKKNSRRLALLLVVISCILVSVVQAQAPLLRFQRTLGGNNRDAILPAAGSNISYPYNVWKKDRDGGYILAAATYTRNNGDVSGSATQNGTAQVWVVKLDSALNILWNKSYGGNSNDLPHAISPTPDGGYIFAAQTDSYDGQVSGNHGFNDVWIVKLDKNGIIQWSKCYGGTKQEVPSDLKVLADGYIIAGSAGSADGDVTGQHDDTGIDAWVIRIDLAGNIVWNKCYGRAGGNDAGGSISQTTDGGFILNGYATGNGGDVSGHHGNNGVADTWLLKLNTVGDVQWQKCLGGTRYEGIADVEQTNDGGYVVAGSTASFDGDVSGYHGGPSDGWLVKLAANGQIQWQKCFGGSQADGFNDVILTPDGGYVTAGWTSSRDGEITEWHGNADYSIAKFSPAGALLWQRSFGGGGGVGGYSFPYGILPVENDFVILGNTDATTAQVTGAHGENDLWLIRIGNSNTIKGNVFIDKNGNGIRDVGESNYNKVTISSLGSGKTYGNITDDGTFNIPVDAGNYITTATPASQYFDVSPSFKTTVFPGSFGVDSFDFALQPIQAAKDVAVSLYALTPARPGFGAVYQIKYENTGTEPLGLGTIKMIKPPGLTYLYAVPAHASVVADTITWTYVGLAPGQAASIDVGFAVTATFGSLLQTEVRIVPGEVVLNPVDDTAILKQVVTGSYDPNDKQESNAGSIDQKYIGDGKWLHYLIRFQNTGNDTAFTVVVRDTLDAKLDLSSFEMVGASHGYSLHITEGNKLAWQFNKILLPDSNVNEVASHGYIAYRIKPKTSVISGDIIRNAAGIYFDYNLPVQTNLHQTVVSAVTLPVRLLRFDGLINNDHVTLTWQTATEHGTKLFEIERSADGLTFKKVGSVKALNTMNGAGYEFNDGSTLYEHNYYRLKIIDFDGKYSYSSVVVLRLKASPVVNLTVYPNPSSTGLLCVNVNGLIAGSCQLTLLDGNGRLVQRNIIGSVTAQSYSTIINMGHLKKGMYVVIFTMGDRRLSQKVLLE